MKKLTEAEKVRHSAAYDAISPMLQYIETSICTLLKAALTPERAEAAVTIVNMEVWSGIDDRIEDMLRDTQKDRELVAKHIHQMLSAVTGRMYTVIDAFVEPVRAEANKNIASRIVWRQANMTIEALKK